MTVDVSPDDLGQLYLEVHRRTHRVIDEAMVAAGLSLSRAKVLKALAECGPLRQATLATQLGLAARSVTELVDALERDAFATRQSDPHDRRAWLVAVTPAGVAALNRATAAKAQAMNEIFGALDAPARAAFAALLTAMRDRLTTDLGETA